MRNSFSLLAHHIIVISIIKDCSNYIAAEEVIAIIQNNRGKISLVKKADINKAKRLKLGRSIILIFL